MGYIPLVAAGATAALAEATAAPALGKSASFFEPLGLALTGLVWLIFMLVGPTSFTVLLRPKRLEATCLHHQTSHHRTSMNTIATNS